MSAKIWKVLTHDTKPASRDRHKHACKPPSPGWLTHWRMKLYEGAVIQCECGSYWKQLVHPGDGMDIYEHLYWSPVIDADWEDAA